MKTELCLILLLTSLFLGACSSDDVIEDPPPLMNTDYTAFTNPELVNIVGYTGEVMEPFFSRDGRAGFCWSVVSYGVSLWALSGWRLSW